MADPLTIIGAAASVGSIVELLGKTVSTLHTLHSRWKEADFTFINLIAQLTALKAALNRLQEWMSTEVDEPHHQLVMDLEASVTCCRMLVRRMDSEVDDLQQDSGTGLDAQNKIRLMIKNGTLEELQKMVDRQTSALTLLLTVCNCKAISEQKIMLEKTSTRKIFRRVKDDTSSLYVQRDSTSIYSRCTDNLSKISKIFEFDRELFISKVYEKALRGSLKASIENMRLDQQHPSETVDQHERNRSKLIDRELEEHAQALRRECKVLLLGDGNCKQTFIKSIKIAHSGNFTDEERQKYRELVMELIKLVIKDMVWTLKNGNISLDDAVEMHAKVLLQENEKFQVGDETLSVEGAIAVQGLWQYKPFLDQLLHGRYVPDSSLYFIEEIERISKNDYLPTDADILELENATLRNSGIQEHTFTIGSLSLHIFDTNQPLAKKKWIHQFEHSTSVVLFVDLSKYCEVQVFKSSDQNGVSESILLFEEVANSPWFSRSSTILLLCNVEHFKESLKSKPLSNYFPDYSGGNDFNEAAKYLLWRFNQVNRAHLDFYSQFCEPSDYSNVRFVWSAVTDSIIQNNLKITELRL